MTYSILLLLFLSATVATAQVGELSDENGYEAKFDLQIRGGTSVPLGKYRLLTDISDDRSAAGIGGYGELAGSFTPLRSSPWRIGLTLGYIYHSFQSEASRIEFSLSKLEGSPWNSVYGLLGVGFTSQHKFYYNIGASAGIMGYSGGNIVSASISLDTMDVQTWTYPTSLVGAVQASLSAGYHFTPKFSMFANVAILYAAGLRKGDLVAERFTVDGQNKLQEPALEQKKSTIQNQTTIFAINIGIGFRYKFYEEPEEFNYKFNIEENQ
jgi:hypothetical protein